MNLLGSKIEAVMQSETGGKRGWLSGFLFFLSAIFGTVARIRDQCYDRGIIRTKKLPCRVISVGNLSAGGTGKTPMTVYMAEWLCQSGLRPVIISRGYRGGAEHSGGVVSDGQNVIMDADQAGDEPYMMACRLPSVPLLVGKDRYEMGTRAIAQFHPDVILLDDGFQHRRLFRDMDLVLIDDRRYLGNGHLIPRGMLREPESALQRADAVILTRCDPDARSISYDRLKAAVPGKPVFKTVHVPYAHLLVRHGRPEWGWDLANLKQRNAFVFSGIAQNDEFARMVAELAGAVAGAAEFADHHPYTPGDLDRIRQGATESRADIIVTTEKDYVRLPKKPQLGMDLGVIGIRIEFMEQAFEFTELIEQNLPGDRG